MNLENKKKLTKYLCPFGNGREGLHILVIASPNGLVLIDLVGERGNFVSLPKAQAL